MLGDHETKKPSIPKLLAQEGKFFHVFHKVEREESGRKGGMR